MTTTIADTFEALATKPPSRRKPELLAPAGNFECLRAAVENGADAVYFGLQSLNARARAANFEIGEAKAAFEYLRRKGVRGYVTLNTLVFPRELEELERIVREIIDGGVDAIIVQDVGVARLIREVSSEVEIHASTQMSVTSTAGVRMARELGCSRVILARELSVSEIAKISEESPLPLEVFVHGALCVAYSGQCLTSEALGGRSANRGECAQACRLPYEILRDGEALDLDRVKYLLSPQDLAAYDLVPRLMEIGVASLKIEGRLKTPEYVANITSHYRRAIDEAALGVPSSFTHDDAREMELSFSRGFSHGFLDGNDHKRLVRGDYAKKRGVFLGTVVGVSGPRIRIELAAPIKRGDGVVFDEDESLGLPEQGGRVYDVANAPIKGKSRVDLAFGRTDLDPKRIAVGQRVWKTDDPELTKRWRSTYQGPSRRKVDLDVSVSAKVGEGLRLRATTLAGFSAEAIDPSPLSPADRLPADPEKLRSQFDRLGDSDYRLGSFSAEVVGGPLVPSSLLNRLRRELVDRLDEAAKPPARLKATDPLALPLLRPKVERETSASPVEIAVLCRTDAQVSAALESGISTIYLDYQDIKGYRSALELTRGGESKVFVASPRIEKPGEANLFHFLAKLGAHGFLVRNAGGLYYCEERGIPFVADFSMNAANELSVEWLKRKGAERVTASYDLNFEQLEDLIASLPSSWLEIVIHQRIPMFHMEHCVFCAFMSPGTDKTNCGRPCDVHEVKLRDRVGMEHPLKADVGCRNTLFNAVPQTAAEYLPRLLSKGVNRFRIEFLDDDPAGVKRIISLYREAIEGKRDSRNLWRELKATGRYGVTRGPLNIL